MSAQDRSTSSSHGGGARRSRRGWVIAGAAIGVLAVLGGAGTLAYARESGWYHDNGGSMNAERFAEHLEDGVKYVLSQVDATAEQKTQVTAILQAAAPEMQVLADQHHIAGKQLHDILSAQSIDRTRLEALRVAELKLADEASQRILRGIADAAEVLTPQQRSVLAKYLERHGHRRGNRD